MIGRDPALNAALMEKLEEYQQQQVQPATIPRRRQTLPVLVEEIGAGREQGHVPSMIARRRQTLGLCNNIPFGVRGRKRQSIPVAECRQIRQSTGNIQPVAPVAAIPARQSTALFVETKLREYDVLGDIDVDRSEISELLRKYDIDDFTNNDALECADEVFGTLNYSASTDDE